MNLYFSNTNAYDLSMKRSKSTWFHQTWEASSPGYFISSFKVSVSPFWRRGFFKGLNMYEQWRTFYSMHQNHLNKTFVPRPQEFVMKYGYNRSPEEDSSKMQTMDHVYAISPLEAFGSRELKNTHYSQIYQEILTYEICKTPKVPNILTTFKAQHLKRSLFEAAMPPPSHLPYKRKCELSYI